MEVLDKVRGPEGLGYHRGKTNMDLPSWIHIYQGLGSLRTYKTVRVTYENVVGDDTTWWTFYVYDLIGDGAAWGVDPYSDTFKDGQAERHGQYDGWAEAKGHWTDEGGDPRPLRLMRVGG